MGRSLKLIASVLVILSGTIACAQIPAGFVKTTATVNALANGTFGAAWTNLSSSSQLALLGGLSTFQQTVNGNLDSSGKMSVLLDRGKPSPLADGQLFIVSGNTQSRHVNTI